MIQVAESAPTVGLTTTTTCSTSKTGMAMALLAADHRGRLIDNIVDSLQTVPRDIQVRQIRHFHRADSEYGEGVACGLGLDLSDIAEPEKAGKH